MEPRPPEDTGHDRTHPSESTFSVAPEVSPSSSSCVSSRDIFNRSTGEILNVDADVNQGRLSLSDQALTGLSPSFVPQYMDVIDLDVSRNHLYSLMSKWFPNCKRLKISQNFLCRISSLAPLATELEVLILDENDVNSLDGIQKFLRLRVLSLSSNALRTVPLMDTHSLRVLQLDANLLSEIPDLSRLCNLEILGLGNNKIMRFNNIATLLPKSLLELNIANNPVVDISQLIFLVSFQSLLKLDLCPLPCLPNSISAPFNYKHLVLCVLHDVTHIDGQPVEPADLICGEHLTIMGKIMGSKREFQPGGGEEAHSYVCAYLAKVTEDCVEKKTGSDTPLRARMMKALRKKNEYESEGSARQALSPRDQQEPHSSSRTTEDEFSTHSPFADWSRHLGKENADPETTDASSLASNRSPISRGRRVIETGVGRKTKCPRSGSVGSRLSSFASAIRAGASDRGKTTEDEGEEGGSTLRELSAPVTVCSSPTPLFEETPKPKPRTVLSSKTPSPPKNKVVDFASPPPSTPVSSRWASERTPSRITRVADVSMMQSVQRGASVTDRLAELESTVAALSQHNELLARTNEELSLLMTEQQQHYTAMLEQCQERIDRLTEEVRRPAEPPTPYALGVLRRTENTAEVKWELRHVKEYSVVIDGQATGRVTAPSRIARISDLDPLKEHIVQLQSVGFDGSLGKLSAPLKIPALDQ